MLWSMLVHAFATHVAPPEPAFRHTLIDRSDRSDPALRSDLAALVDQVGRRSLDGPRRESEVRAHLKRVQTRVAFDIDDDVDPALLRRWAERSNALLRLPDQTLRDPSLRVLFHPERHREDEAAVVPHLPHGVDRRLANIAVLVAWGISTPHDLPPMPADPEIRLRPIGAIIDRMTSLLAVARRSESIQNRAPMPWDDLKASLPRALSALTPIEHEHLTTTTPAAHRTHNMAWRFECLPVFLWTLGLSDGIDMPTERCDRATVTEAVLSTDLDAVERHGWVRPVGELLDHADLLYRLHWALRDAQLSDRQSPPSVDPGVLIERRWAFEWLLDAEAPWDDICLST